MATRTATDTSLKAVALIHGDHNVRVSLQFLEHPKGVTHVKGMLTGLSPGLHGFHIHALGDTTNGCNSTGPHYNPLKRNHGAPSDQERHAGDLGNIIAGPDGIAEVSIVDLQIPLSGHNSILGRAVVVHADPDDLGKETVKATPCTSVAILMLPQAKNKSKHRRRPTLRQKRYSSKQLEAMQKQLAENDAAMGVHDTGVSPLKELSDPHVISKMDLHGILEIMPTWFLPCRNIADLGYSRLRSWECDLCLPPISYRGEDSGFGRSAG